MKVLAISGSPRKDGNTEILISRVLEGMGLTEFEIVRVNDLLIRGCQGCRSCRTEGATGCVQDDDMQKLYPLIKEADVLVMGSPIYYGYLTGQMKCFIDRWYAFRDVNRELRLPDGKKCVFVIAQGAPGRERYEAVITDIRHIFEKYGINASVVVADGVEDKGSVLNHEEVIEEAFFIGASVVSSKKCRDIAK